MDLISHLNFMSETRGSISYPNRKRREAGSLLRTARDERLDRSCGKLQGIRYKCRSGQHHYFEQNCYDRTKKDEKKIAGNEAAHSGQPIERGRHVAGPTVHLTQHPGPRNKCGHSYPALEHGRFALPQPVCGCELPARPSGCIRIKRGGVT